MDRRHLAIPALALALVLTACATSPVYLSDLVDRNYPDLNSMFDDLDCASRITAFLSEEVSQVQPMRLISLGMKLRAICPW